MESKTLNKFEKQDIKKFFITELKNSILKLNEYFQQISFQKIRQTNLDDDSQKQIKVHLQNMYNYTQLPQKQQKNTDLLDFCKFITNFYNKNDNKSGLLLKCQWIEKYALYKNKSREMLFNKQETKIIEKQSLTQQQQKQQEIYEDLKKSQKKSKKQKQLEIENQENEKKIIKEKQFQNEYNENVDPFIIEIQQNYLDIMNKYSIHAMYDKQKINDQYWDNWQLLSLKNNIWGQFDGNTIHVYGKRKNNERSYNKYLSVCPQFEQKDLMLKNKASSWGGKKQNLEKFYQFKVEEDKYNKLFYKACFQCYQIKSLGEQKINQYKQVVNLINKIKQSKKFRKEIVMEICEMLTFSQEGHSIKYLLQMDKQLVTKKKLIQN